MFIVNSLFSFCDKYQKETISDRSGKCTITVLYNKKTRMGKGKTDLPHQSITIRAYQNGVGIWEDISEKIAKLSPHGQIELGKKIGNEEIGSHRLLGYIQEIEFACLPREEQLLQKKVDLEKKLKGLQEEYDRELKTIEEQEHALTVLEGRGRSPSSCSTVRLDILFSMNAEKVSWWDTIRYKNEAGSCSPEKIGRVKCYKKMIEKIRSMGKSPDYFGCRVELESVLSDKQHPHHQKIVAIMRKEYRGPHEEDFQNFIRNSTYHSGSFSDDLLIYAGVKPVRVLEEKKLALQARFIPFMKELGQKITDIEKEIQDKND